MPRLEAAFAVPQSALYPLMGSAAFRDITVGSNGAYNAGKGFDLVTGLSVPNLKALIAAL